MSNPNFEFPPKQVDNKESKTEAEKEWALNILKQRGYDNVDRETIRVSSRENGFACYKCEKQAIAFTVLNNRNKPKERRFCCSDPKCEYDKVKLIY